MASILDILKNAAAQKAQQLRDATRAAQNKPKFVGPVQQAFGPQPQKQPAQQPTTLNSGASDAASRLGVSVPSGGVLQTVGDTIKSLPKAAYSAGKSIYDTGAGALSALDRAATPVGGVSPFTGYQSPIKRNEGESTASLVARATGNFAGDFTTAGNEAAKLTIPQYRAMTLIPEAIGKGTSQLPQEVQSYATPALQAYAIMKSPNKLATAAGMGLQYGTDNVSKYFTGKTVAENIQGSSLPKPAKDILGAAAQLIPSMVGAKVGTTATRNMPAYKVAADSLVRKPTDIKGAMKAYDTKLARLARDRDAPASADVLAYRQEGKKRDVLLTGNKPEELAITKSGEFKKVQKPTESKKVAQIFRKDKIVADAEQQKLLEKYQKKLGFTERERKTFAEMQEGAKKFSLDTDELLASNKKLSAEKIIALKDLIAQEIAFIAKNDVKTIPIGGDVKSAQIMQMKVDGARGRLQQAIQKLIPAGTEAGRTVVAFKLLANASMDPVSWIYRAQKNKGSIPLTQQETTNINKLVNSGDRTALAIYTASLRRASLAEKIATAWKAGLLSGPLTHVRNVGSSTGMALLKVPEQTLATAMDIAISKATGRPRTTSYSPIEQLKGFGQGAKDAYHVLKTGIAPDDAAKVDMPVNPIKNKTLRAYTDFVFNTLGAEDALFKGSAFKESIGSQAKVIAINSGLKGQARKDMANQLRTNPTDEMKLQAKQDAAIATFSNSNYVADKVSALKRGLYESDEPGHQVGALALDATTPFVKTPVNVAVAAANRTPLGLFTTMIKQASPTTSGQKSLVEGLSKSITGTGIMALGAMLFSKGMATGNLPSDQDEKDQFYESGKKPSSVKIGDNWYQLSSVSPIGMLLSLGAEYARLGEGDPDKVKQVVGTVGAGAKGLLNQTFFKGLADALAASLDPDRNAGNYLENLASSTVPTIVTRTAQGFDPVMRNPDGVGEAFLSKIPGLSDSVAPRVGIFGEEVNRGGGLVKSMFDAFNTTKANTDPTLAEIMRLKAGVGIPSDRVDNTQLDTHEFAQYQKKQGKVLKSVLDTLTTSDMYMNLSDSDKKEMIESAAAKVADATRNIVLPTIYKDRYQLPDGIDGAQLRQVVSKLNAQPVFKELSSDKQQQVLAEIMGAISAAQ